MSKEEILEGNRLIAEFMGATIDQYNNVRFVLPADGIGLAGCGLHACRYHSSWDWLMPVVEKISKMPLLNVDGSECTDPIDTSYPITFNMPDPEEPVKVMFRFKGYALHFGERLIDVVWNAVVDVCKFNNQHPKQ